MKIAVTSLKSGIRPLLVVIYLSLVLPARALTEANPYTAIVGRNTFALKPPAPPPAPAAPQAAPPPNVSLQGISTILGRAQALLKVKIAPRPPEPAKELSLVMDVGQREGDVEVLSIDSAAGTVNLSNQGSPLTLNIKDADKPAAGPAIVATVAPVPLGAAGARLSAPLNTPGQAPAIPNSAIPAYQKPTESTLPPAQTVPALPNRPIRGAAQPAAQNTLSAAEQAVVMEVERIRTKDLVKQGKYPPLPPIPGVTPPEE